MAWMEPQQWYAQLAAFYAATAVLITDHGRVLLVKPNYRDHWAIPGGYIDQHEAPHAALVREMREELGFSLQPGPLLVLDWASAAGPRPRPLINFLFDGGLYESAQPLMINRDELDAYAFCDPDECRRLLPGPVAPRIDAMLEARAKGTTIYMLDGVVSGSSSFAVGEA
jgi:8-oxo-dGTP pyrophosphatase MutT (NUDIX family)